ncbi:amidohydrolase family protein, partial [Azospirillum brasilense]|nr:amidohydrolase family protein [Azospirillum brasilense]
MTGGTGNGRAGIGRRGAIAGSAAATLLASPLLTRLGNAAMPSSDLLIVNAKITTLDRANPQADAAAIRDGRFLAVGREAEVRAAASPDATVIDAKGRRLIPGLIDSHIHVIRGGLNYNMELRWDGVPTLADAMAMLRAQVARTPAPQWVRVVGGFTEHQFAEKRLPTLEELNAPAPDPPAFILHLSHPRRLNPPPPPRRGHG